MPPVLSVSPLARSPDTVNMALRSSSEGSVPVYVPPLVTESTGVALTTSITSTSESDKVPLAVRVLSARGSLISSTSVKSAESLSPART